MYRVYSCFTYFIHIKSMEPSKQIFEKATEMHAKKHGKKKEMYACFLSRTILEHLDEQELRIKSLELDIKTLKGFEK